MITKEQILQKMDDVKRSIGNGIKSVADYAAQNPLVSIATLTVLTKAVGGAYKAVSDAKREAKEERARLEDWDPRAGHYVRRTRELKGYELEYVDRERDKGRKLTDIYAELGVLDRH